MRRMSMNTAGAARIGAAGFMNGQRDGTECAAVLAARPMKENYDGRTNQSSIVCRGLRRI